MMTLNTISEFAHCFPDGQPLRPIDDPAAWTADEMQKSRAWLVQFSDQDIGILLQAVRDLPEKARNFVTFNHDTLPDLLSVKRADVPLPGLAEKLSDIREELLHGRGVALLRGLPVAEISRFEAAASLWVLSLHLGDGMWPQNKRGHVLGHIKDIGQTVHNPNQRGPYSADRLPFHVDCADIVGLLCLQTAKKGGESRIVSSVTIFNEMVARRPDLAAVLTRPYYRDRRGEIPPGMKPWYALPIFTLHDGHFAASIEPTYIGSADRFSDVPAMSDIQREALEYVQRLSADLALDMGFQRGDIQLLNNHVIFHSRYHFDDYSDPARRRHLLRIWLKCLDGRPLDDMFYLRHGPRDAVDRPGGIVGPDTVLTAPYDDAPSGA